MENRLVQLQSEMEAGNLMIGFQFVVPISEDRTYWLFGDASSQDIFSITTIESDHFCFSQTSGQATLIRCVPYTNIASFDYIGT